MPPLTIGIDLGGTKILAAVLDQRGIILARAKTSTDLKGGVDRITAQMHKIAAKALQEAGATWADVEHIGAAVPTAVDPRTGDALHAPALGWRNVPIRVAIERTFGRSVSIENDVNCGVLAEHRFGAAQGTETMVGYFLGTGLGGGLVINGQLHRGKRGLAGELGHEIIVADGRTCGCGRRGCLEAYASKTAFLKDFHRRIIGRGDASLLSELLDGDFTQVKSKHLKRAWRAGDPVTQEVLVEGCHYLGLAVANIHAVLAPDCVVFGGGVMEALGVELLPLILHSAREALFALDPTDLDLRLSALGDDAVPMGAALIARGH